MPSPPSARSGSGLASGSSERQAASLTRPSSGHPRASTSPATACGSCCDGLPHLSRPHPAVHVSFLLPNGDSDPGTALRELSRARQRRRRTSGRGAVRRMPEQECPGLRADQPSPDAGGQGTVCKWRRRDPGRWGRLCPARLGSIPPPDAGPRHTWCGVRSGRCAAVREPGVSRSNHMRRPLPLTPVEWPPRPCLE